MTATPRSPGTVLLAGATGDLGGRILRNLLALGSWTTARDVLAEQQRG